MTLRLLLGDQLNSNHSWYQEQRDDVLYFMAEMRQETDYVKHHIQKVVAFFRSMRSFSDALQAKGHTVIYYQLDDPINQQNLSKNLSTLIAQKEIKKFEYQLPDEHRLDTQLKDFCSQISIKTAFYDTEHFFTSRNEVKNFFSSKKQFVMEYFYRDMRKKHDIMMLTQKDPEGGQWNFDQNNRKKWTGSPKIPLTYQNHTTVTDIVSLLDKEGVETIGTIDTNQFNWPTSRTTAIETLQYFCEHLLIHFGDYQDAMHSEQQYLFHSRLSFAMNSKMLHPREVIQSVIHYWREHEQEIHISQVEGFVRQILGWREYMRGLYWAKMPEYKTLNKLNNTNKLPDFYWTGNTKMNCMHHAITQSLETSYAHHIQRLMITGNYALLTQTDPNDVDQWYLGIYIDAIEWVELPNTRGMSQFADGGLVATKPYVSSGSYINKMSNYCKSCHYKVSKKSEDDACPFNALYWNFIDEKQDFFKNNHRMSMMLNMLHKMDKDKLTALKIRAHHITQNPNSY